MVQKSRRQYIAEGQSYQTALFWTNVEELREFPDSLWVDNNFLSRTSEKYIEAVQDISAQNAFQSEKIGLQATRIILTVHPRPNRKDNRRRRRRSYTAYQSGSPFAGVI
jgi:hypothetical protein